jgi:hypothetical protein
VAEKLAAIESARLQSEAALQARITEIEATKATAQQKGVALQLQLDEMQKVKDAEVAKVKEDAAALIPNSLAFIRINLGMPRRKVAIRHQR